MNAPVAAAPAATVGRMDSAVLGIIFLVAMETMLFCGLIGAYIVLRNYHAPWPPMNAPRLDLPSGTAATLVIVISNIALAVAGRFGGARAGEEAAAAARRRRRTHGAILLALLFGLAFSLMQVQEWRHFLHQGLLGYGIDLTPAPAGGFFPLLRWHLGRTVYGAMFFTLTVTHALHLWAGMAVLAALALRGRLWERVGRLGTRLEVTAWFWHFIGIAWLVLFWLLYVLG